MSNRKNYIIICAALLLSLGFTGCGVSHKSPEGLAKSLIEAYVGGKEKKIKDCYGETKNTEESLQAEIDAAIKYYDAHKIKKMEIVDCDVLSENKDYSYVYITYNLVLENEQEYPCISTYMVGKENKSYYILPPSKITDEMRTQAAGDYAKFMTTDIYKNYTRAYDTFMKRNPGYEDKIAGKLN